MRTHSSPLSAHLLLLRLGGEARHVVDDGGHVGGAVQLHLADAVLVGLQHPLDTCHPTSVTVAFRFFVVGVCVCASVRARMRGRVCVCDCKHVSVHVIVCECVRMCVCVCMCLLVHVCQHVCTTECPCIVISTLY